MKLSLYTYLFEKKGSFYIYNSETEFLFSVSENIYEKLYDGSFEELDQEIFNELKKKRIVVEDSKLYETYYSSKLSYLSNIAGIKDLELIIAPTTACNFACPYCFEGQKENHRISNETIKNLVSFINSYEIVKHLNITWYGGEPLLAFKEIKTIIDRINKNCHAKIASQSIVTNGYLLTGEVMNFMFENKFDHMQVTLDGKEERHNKTRYLKANHKPTFSHILKNIHCFIEKMPTNFKIDIRVNINKNNIHDFSYLYHHFKQCYNNNNIRIYPGFIREEGKKSAQMCYKSLFGPSRYEFYKTIETEGVPVDYFPHKESHKGCMACRNNSFIVGPAGELYKCWNDFNNPDKIVGFIHEEKLRKPSLICQYLHDTSIFNDLRCKECMLFPVCDGGCQWFRHQNLFYGKNYNLCPYFSNRKILEECLLK